MSLIACTFAEDAPFIIGDLLFSSRIGNKNFIAPTHAKADTEKLTNNAALKPDELFQKTYIIRDNIAIALAGMETEMTAFLKELKLQMSYYENISITNMRDFVDNYDLKTNYSNSVFLIIVAEQQIDGSVYFGRFTCGTWQEKTHPVFNKVLACAAGANSFMDKLDEPFSFTTSYNKDPFKNACTANLILLSQWLTTEKVTGRTLNENWGGGYEMIYYDGSSFRKFEQIAFVVLESIMDQDGKMNPLAPTLVNYHTYKDGILLLYSFPIHSGTVWQESERWMYQIKPGQFEPHLFLVPPLDIEPGTLFKEEDHSFKTRHIAAGVSIWYKDSSTFRPGLYLETNEIGLAFKENEYIEASILTSLSKEMEDNARKYLPVS